MGLGLAILIACGGARMWPITFGQERVRKG